MKRVIVVFSWIVLAAWGLFLHATQKDIMDYLSPIEEIPFVIDMGGSGNAIFYLYMKGFSMPEPWGRWTEGKKAELFFTTDSAIREPFDLLLFFDIMAGPGHAQQVDLAYNGRHLYRLHFSSPHNHCLRVELPARPELKHRLTLNISHPLAPILHDPQSNDARLLGMGLKRLVLVPKSHAEASCERRTNATPNQ